MIKDWKIYFFCFFNIQLEVNNFKVELNIDIDFSKKKTEYFTLQALKIRGIFYFWNTCFLGRRLRIWNHILAIGIEKPIFT